MKSLNLNTRTADKKKNSTQTIGRELMLDKYKTTRSANVQLLHCHVHTCQASLPINTVLASI